MMAATRPQFSCDRCGATKDLEQIGAGTLCFSCQKPGAMIVYLVTSGSYSDYRIEGAFSSRENAQECIDRLSRWDEAKIEEWPLDDLTASLRDPRPIWEVAMDLDGTTRQVEQRKMTLHDLESTRGAPWTMQD